MAYLNGKEILFSPNVVVGDSKLTTKVIKKNGIYRAENDGADGYLSVQVDVPIQQNLQTIKHVTKNGIVSADEGYDGMVAVDVNVPIPQLQQEKEITKNGIYEASADGYDGYKKVTVSVPEKNIHHGIKTFTQNGLYSALSEGYDGYGNVSVNVDDGTSTIASILNGTIERLTISVSSLRHNAFAMCSKLTYVELPTTTSMSFSAFTNCSALTAVVLSGALFCSLASTSVFSNTPIATGTGFVYVPDNLLDSYKKGTNWVTYANQIKPISELPTE